MSKTYCPGTKADAIIERQVAKGNFTSADEVIEAGLRLLEEHDEELAELRRLIDEGDADVSEGHVHRYATAAELVADVLTEGRAGSTPGS
jgi:antitoxin ParD1/3/4